MNADIEMGKRIRTRRRELKMSQPQLAEVIGVSFQQLYKYEKGTNRINAHRLSLIASALKVRPGSLFQCDVNVPVNASSVIDVTDKDMLRMLRAWSRIKDEVTQREMVVLAEFIAAAQNND